MRHLLGTAGLVVGVAAAVLGMPGPATAGGDGPAEGVLYSGRQGHGRVRMIQIGRLHGRPLLLLDVEVECGGFTPEGRGVAVVEDDGRFEVALAATDTDTSDSVTGDFDDIDGKVRPDAAVLEIDVDVRGEDNAGPTGSCEETQQWRLRGRPDRGATKVDGAVPVEADAVAVGGAAVFTLRQGDGAPGEVTRVDPDTLRKTWRVNAGHGAAGIAASREAVWVLDRLLTVRRLDASTGTEIARIPLVPAETAREARSVFAPMAATDRALWVGVDGLELLFRIDGATNTVTAAVPTPGGVRALAPAPDGVFASIANPDGTQSGGRLVHIDDSGAEVTSVALVDTASALAFDEATLWLQGLSGTVTAHDPATLVPHSGELRFAPGTLVDGLVAATPGAWTSTEQGLLAIDSSLQRAGTVPVVGAADVSSTAAGDQRLWVVDSGYLVRVDD